MDTVTEEDDFLKRIRIFNAINDDPTIKPEETKRMLGALSAVSPALVKELMIKNNKEVV